MIRVFVRYFSVMMILDVISYQVGADAQVQMFEQILRYENLDDSTDVQMCSSQCFDRFSDVQVWMIQQMFICTTPDIKRDVQMCKSG